MMDYIKLREEELREAACFGDLERLEYLISTGVDVNSKNPVNGWTALHWAAYRGNAAAVTILLRNRANTDCFNNKYESPKSVASTEEVLTLLDGDTYYKREVHLPITPNYLRNPPLSCPGINHFKTIMTKDSETKHSDCENGLLLRLRVKEEPSEFVEIEIPGSELTFEALKGICADELKKDPGCIKKILKLPNTLIRNDKDVSRLKDFQEIACFSFV